MLLVRAGTVLAAGFDTGSLSQTGSPVPLVDGGHAIQLGRGAPRRVVVGSNEATLGEVFVHSFPDHSIKLQVSVGGGASSAWRGDERELYYRSAGAMMAVDITAEPKLSAGKPRMLFRDQYAQIQGKNYDVTPDGQRFLMVRTDEQIAPRDITVVLNWMHDLESRLAASR
jgi:hypothetical protein